MSPRRVGSLVGLWRAHEDASERRPPPHPFGSQAPAALAPGGWNGTLLGGVELLPRPRLPAPPPAVVRELRVGKDCECDCCDDAQLPSPPPLMLLWADALDDALDGRLETRARVDLMPMDSVEASTRAGWWACGVMGISAALAWPPAPSLARWETLLPLLARTTRLSFRHERCASKLGCSLGCSLGCCAAASSSRFSASTAVPVGGPVVGRCRSSCHTQAPTHAVYIQ